MARSLPPLPDPGVPGILCYVDKARGRYRVQFTRDGKRKVITLSTTNPSRAAREFADMAARWDAGRLDPWADTLKAPTVQEAIDRYIASGSKWRQSTRDQREVVLNAFRQTLPDQALLKNVSLEECRRFYEARHIRPGSRPTYYNVLSTWLRWCVKHRLLDASPLDGARRPRAPRGLPAYFTPAQFQALMRKIREDILLKQPLTGFASNASTGIEDLPDIVTVAVHTGLRLGELRHLRWLDVDFRAGLVHVRAYDDTRRGISFQPKDSDSRVVPLSPTCREILKARHAKRSDEDDTALVFPSPRTGGPRDGKRLSRTFKGYVEAAGLPDNLHFHSLRHTFASWHISGGTQLVTLQRWMGHSKIEMTLVYADLLPSALEWRPNPYFDQALPAHPEKVGAFLGVEHTTNMYNHGQSGAQG